MESAIPVHLRCPRTRTTRASDVYNPPSPAWCARMDPRVTQIVMGYFGVQYRRESHRDQAQQFVMTMRRFFALVAGPGYTDLVSYVDEAGFDNWIVVAYWHDVASFHRWIEDPLLAVWWNDPARLDDGVGLFREIICPRVAHFETLYSSVDRLEGVGRLANSVSDEVREHAYWGSTRDRLPIAQTDALVPVGEMTLHTSLQCSRRVRVTPHANVTLIRSGQDWSETQLQERAAYLQTVEPLLREGMDFLRDNGLGVGCYSNRYVTHLDSHFQPIEKSFGMSYWRSLEHLERWSESHPTHLAIFGVFLRMMDNLTSPPQLRLYHEVTVASTDEQSYEYVNCHPQTGLLRVSCG
jgi:aldoxime dehydratase